MKTNTQPPKPMVQNISCILPQTEELGGLFLGNVYGAQNAQILKQYGIRAIITASIETKINHSFDDIPFHLKIDAHDKDDYYITEHINDCIHFIEQNRKFTNVFVHCFAGVSRSSAIVAAYLMWKYRWPLQKTISFMVYKRIVAKPNDGFYRQLKQVQTKLNIVVNDCENMYQEGAQIVQRERVIVKPNSPIIAEGQITQNRPQSNKSITATAGMLKPQSPPLQIQESQKMRPNQPFMVPHGQQIKQDAKLNPLQNNSNFNKSVHQRPPMPIPDKQPIKHAQNHNQIPIPKVLARKSGSAYDNSNGDPNDYYSHNRPQNKQKNRRNPFNDYMSPEVLPTSPRMQPQQKNSLGKMMPSNFGNNSKYPMNSGRQYGDSSIYSTNMNTSNNMSSTKKSFQSQQKSKTTSRCFIRPKDLPGYKNY